MISALEDPLFLVQCWFPYFREKGEQCEGARGPELTHTSGQRWGANELRNGWRKQLSENSPLILLIFVLGGSHAEQLILPVTTRSTRATHMQPKHVCYCKSMITFSPFAKAFFWPCLLGPKLLRAIELISSRSSPFCVTRNMILTPCCTLPCHQTL